MFASLKDEFIHANEFTFLYFIYILTYCILLNDIILDIFIYKLKRLVYFGRFMSTNLIISCAILEGYCFVYVT